MTARDIVRNALLEEGIIPSGGQPSADEMTDCLTRLNAMLSSWAVRSSALWREDERDVLMSGGAVVLEPDVAEVVGARLVQGGQERLLSLWERDDYLSLPRKATTGTPTALYVSRDADELRLRLYPVPAAPVTLRLDIMRKPTEATSPNDQVDVPDAFREAVYANLARRCAPMFGNQPGPELVERAAMLERQMTDAGRPASYQMGPRP